MTTDVELLHPPDVAGVACDVSGCPPELAALLREVPIDEAMVREFRAAQRRVGLTHGDRTICSVLSPLVLSDPFYRRICGAATLVVAAVERMVARALVDDELRRVLGVEEGERELYAPEAAAGGPAVVVGRLDLMIGHPDLAPSTEGTSIADALASGRPSFAFIELNAESPAGITDQAAIEQTLYRLPPVARWLAGRRARRSDLPRALLAALRDTHRAAGGDGDPRIAIVDWRGDTVAEQESLARTFAADGAFAACAEPDDLTYASGRLRLRGEPIDLVYRRLLTRELLDRTDASHPLRRALRDGAVCVANPLRSTIANRKALLAALCDPSLASLLSGEQRAAVRAHVPWSRILDRDARDRRELEELVRARRESLILKPNDAFGGAGVVPGWTVDDGAWRQALARGFAERGIVQQRFHPSRLRFPTLADDGGKEMLRWQELGFDCNPFLFRGEVAGAMVRVSPSAVSNVSAGGGVTGLFVDVTEAGDARRDAPAQRDGAPECGLV